MLVRALQCLLSAHNHTAAQLNKAERPRQLWQETCLESCEANEVLLQQKHYKRCCPLNSFISTHYMCCADLRSLTQTCISCEWLMRASASFLVTATKRKFIRGAHSYWDYYPEPHRAKITLSFLEWLLFSLLWSEKLQSGCSFCWLHGYSSRWRQTTIVICESLNHMQPWTDSCYGCLVEQCKKIAFHDARSQYVYMCERDPLCLRAWERSMRE